jgi:hypothetical protein
MKVAVTVAISFSGADVKLVPFWLLSPLPLLLPFSFLLLQILAQTI